MSMTIVCEHQSLMGPDVKTQMRLPTVSYGNEYRPLPVSNVTFCEGHLAEGALLMLQMRLTSVDSFYWAHIFSIYEA